MGKTVTYLSSRCGRINACDKDHWLWPTVVQVLLMQESEAARVIYMHAAPPLTVQCQCGALLTFEILVQSQCVCQSEDQSPSLGRCTIRLLLKLFCLEVGRLA